MFNCWPFNISAKRRAAELARKDEADRLAKEAWQAKERERQARLLLAQMRAQPAAMRSAPPVNRLTPEQWAKLDASAAGKRPEQPAHNPQVAMYQTIHQPAVVRETVREDQWGLSDVVVMAGAAASIYTATNWANSSGDNPPADDCSSRSTGYDAPSSSDSYSCDTNSYDSSSSYTSE